MIQSYDSTAFGKVTLTSNNLSGAPAGYAIWKVAGTVVGSGSVNRDNKE